MGIGGHMETGALVKDGRSDRTSLVAETDVRGPPVGGRWEGGEKASVMEGTGKSSFESVEGKERACYLSRAGHGLGGGNYYESACARDHLAMVASLDRIGLLLRHRNRPAWAYTILPSHPLFSSPLSAAGHSHPHLRLI